MLRILTFGVACFVFMHLYQQNRKNREALARESRLVEKLEGELSRERGQLDRDQGSRQLRLQKWESELRAAKEEREAVQVELTKERALIREEDDLPAMEADVSRQKTVVDALSKQLQALTNQASSSKSALQQSLSETNVAQKRDLADLGNQIQDAQSQLNELKNQLLAARVAHDVQAELGLRNQLAAQKDALVQLKQNRADLNDRYNAQKAQLSDPSGSGAARGALAELRSRLQSEKATYQSLNDRYQNVKQGHSVGVARIKSLQDRDAQLETEIQGLESQIASEKSGS